MRKLFVRRWATIAVMAAGLIGLTATGASAGWDYSGPPVGAPIVGPGCGYANTYGGATNGGNNWGTWSAVGSGWATTDSADYSGPDAAYDSLDAAGTCDGTSYNVLTQPVETAGFSWEFYVNATGGAQNCQVYAYIPSHNAGDYDTRYDFYTTDYSGTTRWLGWVGQAINQELLQDFIHIGDLTVPGNTWVLQVIMTNEDPNAPDRWAGAGDMAFWCK
jgi:hypothetical protein